MHDRFDFAGLAAVDGREYRLSDVHVAADEALDLGGGGHVPVDVVSWEDGADPKEDDCSGGLGANPRTSVASGGVVTTRTWGMFGCTMLYDSAVALLASFLLAGVPLNLEQ